MKKVFSTLLAAIMVFTMLAVPVFATDIEDGSEAYVTVGSMNVTKNPTPSGSISVVYQNEKLTVLEAYINGKDQIADNYHKVQLKDGTIGYVYAYANRKDTLEAAEDFEEKLNESLKSDDEKYQHAINMVFLADYIYGGSKTTEGEEMNFYAKVPTEWARHKRPASLPLVGKAVIHIGDEGKFGSVKGASSLSGRSARLMITLRALDELNRIRLMILRLRKSQEQRQMPTQHFMQVQQVNLTLSEITKIGVAIWSEGGVDESRGTIRQCGEKDGNCFHKLETCRIFCDARKNCYILDINNQVTTPPEIEAIGKATAPLMVKTTPDSTDYVKSGVYKINQSVQIVDATPQNGHYKIYYKHGLYYVESQYVNVQYTNTQKPAISYKAEVSADCDVSDGSSVVGKVKTGTTVDVIEKDYDGTNSKIYFNSKECYIPTSNLTDFVSTPSASGIAALGAPIGVLAVDSPWSAYGAEAYTKEAYELLKAHEYGESYEGAKIYADILNRNEISFLNDQDWANVYNIEDYSYTPDPDYPDEIETGKAYTILYDGNIRYILQNDEHYQTFTYYPGTEFSKTSVAKTQPVYIDGNKYNAVAYNIDDSNYFKLRDIAEMLNGTIKTFDIKYDASTNSIDMLSYFDYTSVGGELTAGDGETRTAVSSSAFLTLDGVPVQATCYNIDGNNYFKLRDITDVLDCRVDWEEKNQTIWIIPGMTAYDDPNEAVG